ALTDATPRVGLAVALVDVSSARVLRALFGSLAGHSQTVHRGELRALLLAVQRSAGQTLCVSDNLAVCEGWWGRYDQTPCGEDADLWRLMGEEFARRPRGEFVVSHVLSHMDPEKAAALGVDYWVMQGNAVADAIAGVAANLVRLSTEARGRIACVEHTALLVRRRLLRATIDAIEAEGQSAKRKPRRARLVPPGQQAIAVLCTAHVLDGAGGCQPEVSLLGLARGPHGLASGTVRRAASGEPHEGHTLWLHATVDIWLGIR
ncbi:unnamed protein product, partial [Prorocentrum cordatum]